MADHREAFLGREDVNDVESILADDAIDFGELSHAQRVGGDAIFTWDYDRSRPALAKLYEKAKVRQWNAVDLPWDTEVDVEAVAMEMAGAVDHVRQRLSEIDGSPMKAWTQTEWTQFAIEAQNWTLSQFLHGEQGALVCTAKIVETVPWIDAKYYAATQVMDEARHVEVFAKYLDTKLDGHYPINHHLELLLDDIIDDSRWDMTYLGMQIMVEGLALAAFGMAHQTTQDPLLKQLLRYVMSDEARHVAFGVLSLKEFYAELSSAELLDRQEFAFEAAVRMRDRLLQQDVWERMGVDPKVIIPRLRVGDRNEDPFQQLLFSKIVPNCKKLGLLDRNDHWLRHKFGEMGVIQFEDWVDTGEEYESLSLDATAGEAVA